MYFAAASYQRNTNRLFIKAQEKYRQAEEKHKKELEFLEKKKKKEMDLLEDQKKVAEKHAEMLKARLDAAQKAMEETQRQMEEEVKKYKSTSPSPSPVCTIL